MKPQAGSDRQVERIYTENVLYESRTFSFTNKENYMDLLYQSAKAFDHLLPFEYPFTIGRKGNALSFILDFDSADFHHLSGLHKRKDHVRFTTGKRSDIFQKKWTTQSDRLAIHS